MPNPSATEYLGLLRGELVEHLRRAKAALEPVGNRAVGDLGAAVCVAEVGQVLAVLRPLGLELLGMLAEDLARLGASLEDRIESRRAETIALLRHGIDQLRDGIEQRALGRPEDAWPVLAVLNELRAALGLPLVSQARLFAPDVEDEIARLAAEPGDAHPEFHEAARSERIVLHRAMYLWYSGREPERALRKLRRVAQTMRRVAGIAVVQRLFLVMEAVAVGVADQGGPPTQALRRLLLQIDGLLKAGSEGGEVAVAAALPASLMRNLLFQVGSCGSPHRIVQAVRRSMDLRLLSLSGVDGREGIAPLLQAERARLQGLLDAHIGGCGGSAAILAEVVQGLSDALGLAQAGELRRAFAAPLASLSKLSPGGSPPPDALAALQAALVETGEGLGSASFTPGAAQPLALRVPVEPIAQRTEGGLVEDVEDVATREPVGAFEAWSPAAEPMQPATPVERRESVELPEPIDVAEPLELVRFLDTDEPPAVAEAPEPVTPAVAPPVPMAEELPVEFVEKIVPADVAAETPVAGPAELEALDDDIREVFLDEATERVAALRDAYVAWSAQDEDEQALGTVLHLLGELKSTGRLVGAHTLSEICWVVQAVLERCRDGVLPVAEAVLSVLDEGVEAVDALVAAHVSGAPVAGDPRAVEQHLYALLSADPETLDRLVAPSRRPRPAQAPGDDLLAASELSVADILADEAEDVVEILEDGLDGLVRQPDQEEWLVEMRRALRSLGATARYAQSPPLVALSDAFEAALARGSADGGLVETGAQALRVLRAAVDALRDGRSPVVPHDVIDRLRHGVWEATEGGAAEAAAWTATAEGARPQEGGSRALEEQVAALRDYVGQLEGIVARLARVPQRSADIADRARALHDLGPCADGLHAVSLAIDALVRGPSPT